MWPPRVAAFAKDHVVADLAVVCDMSVSHHQRVAPDAGNAAALHCSTVDGDELSDLAVVADFETRGLAGVSEVLRRHADRGEGEDSVVSSDSSWTLNRDMRNQVAALAQFDVRSNDAIGTNLAGRVHVCASVNDCGGMDAHQALFALGCIVYR